MHLTQRICLLQIEYRKDRNSACYCVLGKGITDPSLTIDGGMNRHSHYIVPMHLRTTNIKVHAQTYTQHTRTPQAHLCITYRHTHTYTDIHTLNIYIYIYIYIYIKLSKVSDRSHGWPKGSLFNTYYTEV